ncbi:MAG TPA: VOC family protein [Streptosporangiaceae bacterium]|jgi:predicted enzyme related to lactoylglutathione lyase
MSAGIKTVIYPVSDLARAKAMFSAVLGTAPVMDEPYYVGFNVNGQDIGLDPHGHKSGAVGYYHVGDIKGTLQALLAAGAELDQDLKDVGGGRLIASVKDADGNLIGLLQDA